ncbi:hypothetical protein GIB67_008146 [Kingdonia uniflora]|uniref:Uncharacterized protein n=1 Tax=Kingdonia uniflora TaxID=39325 RepID=A0A7J7MT62_9MAGN|nr:hypothetical protein GIB67_008146 [Kingdonia uniflora]
MLNLKKKQPQVAEEEEVQEMEESKNGDEKVDDVEKDGEEKESKEEQPQTMVVAEVAKTEIVFFNEEEVAGEAYQTIEVVQTEVVISHQEENVGEASQLVLMESEVDVTLMKRHALTEEENNERAFKMACQMNQLHAHLDQLLPGVLLESFIHRPIFQDEKNQVDQVWSLRKDELSLEAKKNNMNTYMMIGH